MKKESKRTGRTKTQVKPKTASKRSILSPLKITLKRSRLISKPAKKAVKTARVRKKSAAKKLAAAKPVPVTEIFDLPYSYNETKLVLLIRDPFWAYAYWDFSQTTWEWIQGIFNKDHGAKAKLRVYNIDQSLHYDVQVRLETHQWYLDLGLPDHTFEAELGILDSEGKFHSIVKSNRIRTPRNGPSSKIDPDWALSDSDFNCLYKLSGGGQTGHGSEIFSLVRKP